MSALKLQGLLRLFRFELPFAAGVCVVLGEILAYGKIPGASQVILGFLSIFLISASALILNDYFDIETDKINAPERPLPSGLVTEREALALAGMVTLLGSILAWMISTVALWVVILTWVTGFLYNWRFKKAGFVGNLMVTFSVGMTFIFGGIAVGRPLEKIVWVFALMVMLVDLGEEIAADAMDMEGDCQAGSRSLAVLYGREKALKISAVIFFLVIVTSLVPFFCGWLDWIYLFPLLMMDAVILYATRKLLDENVANKRKYIRWIYLSGSAALVIFIVIRSFR
ncbi:MAG TPA: UbiA family prenyltransferase [Anaerolineales bacterium]|jgi:geranylgeranylglycerol-phosphate geranylgeranyltransferase